MSFGDHEKHSPTQDVNTRVQDPSMAGHDRDLPDAPGGSVTRPARCAPPPRARWRAGDDLFATPAIPTRDRGTRGRGRGADAAIPHASFGARPTPRNTGLLFL